MLVYRRNRFDFT